MITININTLIIIGSILLFIILLIIFFKSLSNKKKNNEDNTSILDIHDVGVPNNSEMNDFSYGYEKEETIVMNPIDEEKENIEKEE